MSILICDSSPKCPSLVVDIKVRKKLQDFSGTGNLKKHQTGCNAVPQYRQLKVRLCHHVKYLGKGGQVSVHSGTMHDSTGTVCTPTRHLCSKWYLTPL